MSRTLPAIMAAAAAAILIQFGACSAAAMATAGPNHEEFSGVELPRYGSEIGVSRLFTRPNGSIVIKYHYLLAGTMHVDYYDVDAKLKLAPQIEVELAHDNAPGFQLERANGLKAILPMGTLDLGGRVTAESEGVKENGCSWPYPPTFFLNSNGKNVFSATIFVSLKKPRRVAFGCTYEEDTQPPAATLRYSNPPMSLYPDGKGGFYGVLFELPYVIHFDHSGRSRFFLGRNDLIEVPSGPIDAIASKATSLPAGSSWQPALSEAERLVDRAAAAQQGLK
jgi:hypothetical protein